VILLYHSIAEDASDPWSLRVTPRHFAQHLEVLRKRARPVALNELVPAGGAVAAPARRAAVTFDDGYADNLHHALPLLRRYDVPATIFLATGRIGSDEEFWWDEIGRIVLRPGPLPDVLRLPLGDGVREITLGEAAADFDSDAPERFRAWRVGQPEPTTRHRFYASLFPLLSALPAGERDRAIGALRAWAGVPAAGRPTHRSLTPDEVARLAREARIELGAHTVNHPVLAALGPDAQRAEIRESKAAVEALVPDRPVTCFSYPHGRRPDHYTADTVGLVREAGFRLACATTPARIEGATDPYELPRLTVDDWDGPEFARRLDTWFDG
jgi:peptidoglycan/xylan/chitin deacetylase (PgdA/CDA1 family)